MKKIILIATAGLLLFGACKKKVADTVSQVVKISFPSITLKGAKFVTIPVGSPFVDSGATFADAYTGETGTLVADTGNGTVPVDPTTPGLYTITYTAKNRNTFKSTVARYVAVTNYADTKDISGAYKRLENGNAATVSRKSRALYAMTDIGGVVGGVNPGYFAIIDTATADFGEQYIETLGAVFDADVKYLHLRPADTSIQYIVYGVPGYGTTVRTFKKQ